jgi:hypothetical protein
MDAKKIYKFKSIKKRAGKETQILSFNFNRTINPHNMSSEIPRDDTSRIRLYCNPINNPVAPISSRIIVSSPSFSKLNRLNSFFIWGDMK